jgi:hypothetical protein
MEEAYRYEQVTFGLVALVSLVIKMKDVEETFP